MPALPKNARRNSAAACAPTPSAPPAANSASHANSRSIAPLHAAPGPKEPKAA